MGRAGAGSRGGQGGQPMGSPSHPNNEHAIGGAIHAVLHEPPHPPHHEPPRHEPPHHPPHRPPCGLRFDGRFDMHFYDRMMHILDDIEYRRPVRPEDRDFMYHYLGREVEPYEIHEVRRWLDDERGMY
jgi:hypothetical protein